MGEYLVENTVSNKAKAAGWFVRKVRWIGRRKAPDRVFIKDGRTVWIEFKRAGKGATETQSEEHVEMREHGAAVYVVDNVRVGLRLLEIE